MQDFRTTDNRLIRIQDGGPALIRAGVLLNPQYAADRVKGADLVLQFAKTGDAADHEVFFLQWVASAPAPRMTPEDARLLYIERKTAARLSGERPALANHTTEAVHPHQDGTTIQRTRYAEGRDTLSIFAHDRQLDQAVAEDLLQGARVVQDFDRHRWANSLTVMGDARTFFMDWACQIERKKTGAVLMIEQVWDKVLSEGKKPKAKAARLNREFGRFLASNLAMETQLELIRAKGKNNVITVLHRGNALDNDDHDDWKRGAVIIKDLHDKNDGFYDGFTMFRDWSLQDYTPDQAERWEETVKRVYEVAVETAPYKGTTAVMSCAMSAAGPKAYSPPSVSLVDDAVLLAAAGTAHMIDTSAPCAPCAQGPQVGETWWCLMPSKSRNTLQKMTVTYISTKRVELLITGRPAGSSINLASYRRDDVEFVEVVS